MTIEKPREHCTVTREAMPIIYDFNVDNGNKRRGEDTRYEQTVTNDSTTTMKLWDLQNCRYSSFWQVSMK
jgi:hypothetical protein